MERKEQNNMNNGIKLFLPRLDVDGTESSWEETRPSINNSFPIKIPVSESEFLQVAFVGSTQVSEAEHSHTAQGPFTEVVFPSGRVTKQADP